MSFREALSWICVSKVERCWVPGHSDTKRIQGINKLAKLEVGKGMGMTIRHKNLPDQTYKGHHGRNSQVEHDNRWCSRNDCTISRTMCSKLDKEMASKMLNFPSPSVQKVAGVIPGPCTAGAELRKVGVMSEDYGKERHDEEETM